MANTSTAMQAVVFNGKLQVAVEQRPLPQIQEPTDIIVKVRYTALCGSELHVFRGHQPSATGFIMGHEFTGEVVEVGSRVETLRPGDNIVTPFTVNCGKCFYCAHGFSSRCVECKLFGTPLLEGAQAEYVRIPLADTTVIKAPPSINEKTLVLMADIFPTGYFAAANAFRNLDEQMIADSTVLLLGCGPVGICALISALEYKPKHLLAIDSVESRLQLAKSLGAEPWNFQESKEDLQKRVLELTDGRGADVVIEVVGHSDALSMGFDFLRPWGNISSVGVHNGPTPWSGNQAYSKNIRIQMGRCPVRSIFEDALELLARKQDILEYVGGIHILKRLLMNGSFMVNDVRPLSDAVKAYDDFNQMKSQKIIFEAGK